jgi:DHA1 family multidrug resistance protein-like MFS transporter
MITQTIEWAIYIIYALELGTTIFQLNLITTIQSAMGILFVIPFGMLSDRFGRRPMILYSRVIIIIGTLIRAFATEPNHLIIASITGAFAGGGFFPVLLSIIGDVAKPDERQEAISTMFLFSSIGMLVGPMISSFLLILPSITLRNIYQIAVVAQIGVFIYLATQIRETRETMGNREKSYRIHLRVLLGQRSFQGLVEMAFLYFFSRSIIDTYVPVYARIDLEFSDAEVASLSVFRSLAIMVIRILSATLLTNASPKKSLLFALILNGITGLFSSFAREYWTIVIVLFLSGFSYGAIRILTSVLVARQSSPENRGVANSLYNAVQGVSNMTKISTTPLVDIFGLPPILAFGGIVGLFAIVPAFLYKLVIDR